MTRFCFAAAFCAAVLSLFAAGCKSAGPEQGEAPAFSEIDKGQAAAVICADASAGCPAGIEAGNIYVASNLADRFKIMRPSFAELNEVGLLTVRVYGETAELPFLEWLIFPSNEDKLVSRFFWFDANGKFIAASQPAPRNTLPGNPVRFSATAPSENCRKFSFVVAFRKCGSCPKPEAAAEPALAAEKK